MASTVSVSLLAVAVPTQTHAPGTTRGNSFLQFYGEDFIHVGPTAGAEGSVQARPVYDPYVLLAEESKDGPRVPYYLSQAYLEAVEAPELDADVMSKLEDQQ